MITMDRIHSELCHNLHSMNRYQSNRVMWPFGCQRKYYQNAIVAWDCLFVSPQLNLDRRPDDNILNPFMLRIYSVCLYSVTIQSLIFIAVLQFTLIVMLYLDF